jgi:hypothetical protein
MFMHPPMVIREGNADLVLLDRILRHGLILHGKFMRFSVCVEDLLENLARILDL